MFLCKFMVLVSWNNVVIFTYLGRTGIKQYRCVARLGSLL